ncbi:hypothetical protein [Bartonella sp. HY038]|uniref:hypothetical protein n=1 Tax=Bartonella sp. HY038 TaxID=2759660 RepID=UPI0015FDD9BE|nr:hypothetical protein [Bartonella sp. HY038]
MGKWLAALKKYKNGGIGNTQNPQNYQNGGFEGFECSDYRQKQKFFLNNTPHNDGDFSRAGMLTNVDIAESKTSPQTINPDHKHDMQMLTNVNLLTGTPSTKTGHATTKPRMLKNVESYNSKARLDDAELYARALKLYGAMSYGMAMQVLEWGATRAANAQDQLREAGRIQFNHLGRAVLVKDC